MQLSFYTVQDPCAHSFITLMVSKCWRTASLDRLNPICQNLGDYFAVAPAYPENGLSPPLFTAVTT